MYKNYLFRRRLERVKIDRFIADGKKTNRNAFKPTGKKTFPPNMVKPLYSPLSGFLYGLVGGSAANGRVSERSHREAGG